jgi:Ethanolamine utilization protein
MLYIMLFFSLIAGIDKLLGNKKGLGEKFDQGFLAMGSLALTIIGIYSLSPLIAKLIVPILLPLSEFLHLDPSVFIGSIFSTRFGWVCNKHFDC